MGRSIDGFEWFIKTFENYGGTKRGCSIGGWLGKPVKEG